MSKKAGFLGVCVLACQCQAQMVRDDFSSFDFDSNKWTVVLTFPQSRAFLENDHAVLISRGRLIAKERFGADAFVRGRFRLSTWSDRFAVNLRTDDAPFGGTAGERIGISVRFLFDRFQTRLSIQKLTPTNTLGEILADTAWPLSVNVDYDFFVEDIGDSVRLFMGTNTLPALEATDSFRPGDGILVYNSLEPGFRAEIDYLNVGSLPVLSDTYLVPSLEFFGALGRTHRIDYTEDIGNDARWKPLTTIEITNNPTSFIDTTAPRGRQRFYRLVIP